jgi:hypothetical protein
MRTSVPRSRAAIGGRALDRRVALGAAPSIDPRSFTPFGCRSGIESHAGSCRFAWPSPKPSPHSTLAQLCGLGPYIVGSPTRLRICPSRRQCMARVSAGRPDRSIGARPWHRRAAARRRAALGLRCRQSGYRAATGRWQHRCLRASASTACRAASILLNVEQGWPVATMPYSSDVRTSNLRRVIPLGA